VRTIALAAATYSLEQASEVRWQWFSTCIQVSNLPVLAKERKREMKHDTYYPNHVLSHMLISIVLLD
jgi:hypothetical protein